MPSIFSRSNDYNGRWPSVVILIKVQMTESRWQLWWWWHNCQLPVIEMSSAIFPFKNDAIRPCHHQYAEYHVNTETPSTTSIAFGLNHTYVKASLAFATSYGQPGRNKDHKRQGDQGDEKPTIQDSPSGAIGRWTKTSSSPSNYLDMNRDVMVSFTSKRLLHQVRKFQASTSWWAWAASSSSSQMPTINFLISFNMEISSFCYKEKKKRKIRIRHTSHLKKEKTGFALLEKCIQQIPY